MSTACKTTSLKGFFIVLFLLVASASPAPAGLLVNGDFETGNTGFTTEYDFIPTARMLWPGDYAIVQNPRPYNVEAFSFGDHTTGSGLMMLIDSDWNRHDLVWGQTVSVASNARYTFSGWIASPFIAEPRYMSAYVQVKINDQLVGSVYGPTPSAIWQEFEFSWDSLTATTARIEIFERGDMGHPGRRGGGNDFALDDLAFEGPSAGVVPEPSSAAIFGFGVLVLAFCSNRWRKRVQNHSDESTCARALGAAD